LYDRVHIEDLDALPIMGAKMGLTLGLSTETYQFARV